MYLVIQLLSGPTCSRNPHLRGRFTELLVFLLPHNEDQSGLPNSASHVFTAHTALQSKLLPSLVDFYSEMESVTNFFYGQF